MSNSPASRRAGGLSPGGGGQPVGKYPERGRRSDVRLRLQLKERSSPDDLKTLTLRTNDNRLVPMEDVTSQTIVSTLPVINRYNHQRKVEITASPAHGVSQGEAITRCQEITRRIMPE